MLKARPELNLDSYDLQILALLQTNGRMAKTRIAELIGLSATPCGARIERLEKAGLIRGYHAAIDLAKLAALTRYRVTVVMKDWTPAKASRFESAVARIPNIVECEAVLGEIDYVMTVVAASVAHYQEIMGTLLASDVDNFNYTTYTVSKPVKTWASVALLDLTNTPTES
jgi:Lrp/AsnC family transcriptional regulator of ectoine degradation